jgi:hypothetical protein
MGFGPILRIFSVNVVTTSANRGASAEDTHSIPNRSGAMPWTSKTIRVASLRSNAL